MKKGFKFEIAPNEEQKVFLNKTLGCTRFAYNQALARTIKDYQLHKENPNLPKPNVSKIGLAYLAKIFRIEYSFLNEVSSIAIQQKLMDLGDAYKRFFNGKGFPKFKSKKRNKDSFRLPKGKNKGNGNFYIKDNNLFITKLNSPIKIYWSRKLPTIPSSLTISKTPTGRYYVSFYCDYTSDRQSGNGILGIDVGLKHYATTSEGEHIKNPKYFNKFIKRLAKVQRKHSRKQIGSNNRNKSRIKVAKLNERITNQRKDFQHKLSAKLVNDNQVLVMESLNVKGMKRNRRLAKSISDASWGRFFRMLKYKSKESTEGRVITADQWFPSTQLCSVCNQKTERKVKQGDHWHICSHCGSKTDRDLNAAINLRTMGLAVNTNIPISNIMRLYPAPSYEEMALWPEYL